MENYPLIIQPTCVIRGNRLKFGRLPCEEVPKIDCNKNPGS